MIKLFQMNFVHFLFLLYNKILPTVSPSDKRDQTKEATKE